jgi:type I restriction enzyme S subunit
MRFYKETNFKDTEIGRIPKDWEVVRLGDIVNIIQGENYPVKQLKQRGYPIFGANGLIGYGDKYHYKEEQVLIACRGSTCGIVNMSLPYSFVNNNAMALVRNNDSKIEKKFLFYMMQYNYLNNTIKTVISGTGQPQITITLLSSFKIPLPPLSEQEKIAEILSTLDEKIEIERKRREKLERIKKSLMDLLLTGKIRVRVD